MRKIKLFYGFSLFLGLLFFPFICRAMPPGTLLYRTSGQGKMYGYSQDPLFYSAKGIIKNVYSGHTAIYIGQENGEDYIVEAAEGGIVKTPAKYFVNLAEGEKFLGAKIPKDLTEVERAKAVAIAKSLVDKKLGYDFDFKTQKGPDSGAWTCVGLTEKIYESADISNPNNLDALEYDSDYYAADITPDGFDNYSVVNKEGDCFSRDHEFSKISRRTDLLLPAPELIGYDAGLEQDGERYIFLPYTQFLQPTLKDVPVDITVSSSFNGTEIRGRVSTWGLILKWSLINNPLSSLAVVARKVKEVAVNLTSQIFSGHSGDELALSDANTVLSSSTAKTTKTTAKTTTAKKAVAKSPVTVNKAKTIAVSKASGAVDKITTSSTEASVKSKVSLTSPISEKIKTTAPKFQTTLPTAPVKIASTVKVNKTVPVTPPVTPPAFNSGGTNTNSGSGSGSNQSSNNDSSNSSGNVDQTAASSNETSDNATSTDNTVAETATTTSTATPVARINKIYATGDNDWLELFNPTDQAFDLAVAGYRLEKTKTAEDPALIMRIGNDLDGTYPGGTIIPAQGSYLIVRDDAKAYYKDQADAIATRDDFSWTGSDYTIYLGTDAISSSDDPDIMDAVGYGPNATYYLGAGPAPEISDNYILARVAAAGNNQTDYHLIPTDDPDAVFDDNGNSISTPATDTSLFIPPTPLLSEGLVHLWHFDECSGTSSQDFIDTAVAAPAVLSNENWVAGKWGCGLQVNYNSKASANFTQPIDSANFTVSFRYRAGGSFPRLTLNWFGDDGSAVNWSLNGGFSNFAGLPGVWGNYFFDSPFDDTWRQATIVINQAQLYWSIYIDGLEKFHQPFADFMPLIKSLSVSNTNGPALIDELAVWNRALPQDEILAINNFEAPFWPVADREAQQPPVLSHFWSFDEGSGLAVDSAGSASINVPSGAWGYLGKINHSVNSLWGKDLTADFSSLNSKDLSFAFWYSALDDTNAIDSRVHFSLRQGSNELMSLTPSPYRITYLFNGYSGTFSQTPNNILPRDNEWHHLALTYDSYRYVLSLYVDGQELASSSQIWFADGIRPDNLLIKEENGSVSIDELGLWQGTLSAAKVKEIYEREK